MNSSRSEPVAARADTVSVSDDSLIVELEDGRSLSVPLAWYPRLAEASPAERNRWRFVGHGEGIHWPDLDEDLSIDGLIRGERSAESQSSLRAWRASRIKSA